MCDLCHWQRMVDRLDDLIVHEPDPQRRAAWAAQRIDMLIDRHCFDRQRTMIEQANRPDTPERTRDEIDRTRQALARGVRSV